MSDPAHIGTEIENFPRPQHPQVSPKYVSRLGGEGSFQIDGSVMTRKELRGRDALGLLPSREEDTVLAYRRRLGKLIEQSHPDPGIGDAHRLGHAIEWFAGKDEAFAPATLRHYRAVFLAGIEDLIASGMADQCAVTRMWKTLDDAPGPGPLKAKAHPRTSAKKRKSFSVEEWRALVTWLQARSNTTDRLLAGLVGYGVMLGLRPIEFQRAFVRGYQIFVRCAKRSNGRGLADWRVIDLPGFGEADLNALTRFLAALQHKGRKASSWEAFHGRLAKALLRACVSITIPPICLYSLRHQAVANAKCVLTRRELAAFAGHTSVQTASRDYAKRSGGWGLALNCVPAPESIALVGVPQLNPGPDPADKVEQMDGAGPGMW